MRQTLLYLFFWLTSSYAYAQRNVVLMIADDLGTDYFGFYPGYQDTVGVPNIRGLLGNGVQFNNVMSNPYCSATRSGMLTGRYSFRTGVGGVVGTPGGSGQLDTSEVTIPKLLEVFDPAIAKANIGKWHLHNPMPASNLMNPQALGYDHFEGPFIGALTSYTNWTKYINGVPVTVTNYATSENVDNAVAWVQQQAGNPFFLWLAFNAPHTPYHLPPLNLHSYTGLPGTTQHINQNPKPYFMASVQAMDTEIGRLLDSLQSFGRLDSTDIIFIGDNGNASQTAQVADPAKAKGTIYQYGVQVPMIVSGPSVVNPGRTSDVLVNTADVFATVLELIGFNNWQAFIPAGVTVDSRSLLPVIQNNSVPMRDWAFTELFDNTPDSAEGKTMRDEQYKLIQFDYGTQEFYDLLNDPFENYNLLQGTLTATEWTHYQYLCNEMAALTGGSFCNTGTGTEETIQQLEHTIQPNPFSSHVEVVPLTGDEYFILRNAYGAVCYSGSAIHTCDFSGLAPGLYILQVHRSNAASTYKVMHR